VSATVHSWVDCHQDEPLLEWQRVEPVAVREAIHRLSIFTPSKTYQSASTDGSGCTPDRSEYQGPGHGGWAGGKGGIVHYRGGEGTCGALQEGERNLPTV